MKKYLEEWGKDILQAAVILLLLFYFCWPMRLLGSSMEPTMGDGEIVLMSRFSTMTGNYEKGDIIMFHYYDKDGVRTVVKRIIATEGDHIRILPEGVELNGALLQEDYIFGATDGMVDMTVPADMVFVMGDHRETSYDSRNMGAVSCKDLKGKVFFRVYPFGELGKL